jgi:cytochrome c oxidase subunit 2
LRDPRTRRRLTRTALLLALALAVVACGEAPQTVLDPAGEYAAGPDQLFRWVLLIALGVFVLVQGLIIYAVVKFRERKDDPSLPVQVHGNTKLEIFWTVIPALILAGIAVPTVQSVFELAETPDDAITVEVIGHRWWWEYRYPDHGGFATANELVIPKDVPVKLEMRAEEAGSSQGGVIHSYWIPALAGKQDVVPGRITTLNLQADETGVFLGQCTEYCGLSHGNMRQYATVVEQGEFDQWVEEQNQPAAEPTDELAQRGKELFGALPGRERACASCHAIRGTDAQANIGPDLTHLMSREKYAGAILDLYVPAEEDTDISWTDEVDTELLAEWLRNPGELKAMQPGAGYGMPDLNLDEDEIEALVAYLTTLR